MLLTILNVAREFLKDTKFMFCHTRMRKVKSGCGEILWHCWYCWIECDGKNMFSFSLMSCPTTKTRNPSLYYCSLIVERSDSYICQSHYCKEKCQQPHPGFELGLYNTFSSWFKKMGFKETYMVPSISFQPFFVQAFKIGIDSWTFTMLLLYILWDDSPNFMISGSNEQLQQQLEYTLLKPDCHSWWISKMQSGREDTLEEWYAIKFCFKLGKKATETYGMLQTVFQPSCMNRASVFEWHARFKEGRESVRDNERCGRSKEVNTRELIGQRGRVTMLRF